MVKALQWVLWVVGLGLQSLLIATLFHGAGREFPALFAYVICLLGTTTADILAFVLLGKSSSSFAMYYWSAELVRQSVLFAVVVSLAVHVIPNGRRAEAYGRMFTFSAVTIWVGSVVAHHQDNLNTWMTAVVRNLSFFTGVLDIFVWFAYARSGVRDMPRLLIAAGLGLQMTGEAIGQAVRQLNISRNVNLTGAMIIVLAHLLCLYIWWRALNSENSFSNKTGHLGEDAAS